MPTSVEASTSSPRWKSWRMRSSRRCRRLSRDLCEGVILRVDDFPTEIKALDQGDAESGFDLTWLFEGIVLIVVRQQRGRRAGRRRRPGTIAGRSWIIGPNMRRRWAHIVRHVLIYEIGHHFGLSDDDMAAIEGNADEMWSFRRLSI